MTLTDQLKELEKAKNSLTQRLRVLKDKGELSSPDAVALSSRGKDIIKKIDEIKNHPNFLREQKEIQARGPQSDDIETNIERSSNKQNLEKDNQNSVTTTVTPPPARRRPLTDKEKEELSTEYIKSLEYGEFRGGMDGFVRTLIFPNVMERANLMRDEGFEVNTTNPDYPVVILRKPNGDIIEQPLNSPGWSVQDAISLASTIAEYTPAGRFTSMARSLMKKLARGVASGAATALAKETLQKQLGGEFNEIEILINSVAVAGGGALEELAPVVWKNLTRAQKRKAEATKSFTTLLELGISLDDLKQAVQSRSFKSKSGALESFNITLFKEALENSPILATEFAEKYAKDAASTSASLARVFNNLASQDLPIDVPERALLNIFSSAQDVSSSIQNIRFTRPMQLLGKKYDEVFEEIGEVNLEPALELAEQISKESLPGSEAKKLSQKWISYFSKKKPGDKTTFKPSPPVLDRFGNVTKDATVEVFENQNPNRVAPAKQVHLAIRELGDILKVDPNFNSSVGSQVKINARKVRDELRKALGPKFSEVDEAYSKSANALRKFLDSTKLGTLAKKNELTADKFLDGIFGAKPGTAEFAQASKFIEDVSKQSPEVANDLYGGYFAAKVRSLPEKEDMAKVLSEIYGVRPNGDIRKSTVYRLAPNPSAKRRIQRLGELIQEGAKIDPNKTLQEAMANHINKKRNPNSASWVYLRMAVSNAIKSRSDKKFLEVAHNMALDPKYRKEYLDLLNSKKLLVEAHNVNFLKRSEAAKTYLDKAQNLAEKVYFDMKQGSFLGAQKDLYVYPTPGVIIDQTREDGSPKKIPILRPNP